jgi:hypothetical protein
MSKQRAFPLPLEFFFLPIARKQQAKSFSLTFEGEQKWFDEEEAAWDDEGFFASFNSKVVREELEILTKKKLHGKNLKFCPYSP